MAASLEPAVQDIVIRQGATFTLVVTLADDDGTAVNISGGSGRCQVREEVGGRVLANMAVDVTDGAAGEFELSLGYATTEQLNFDQAVYDVLLQYDGRREMVLRGRVRLDRAVTVWS